MKTVLQYCLFGALAWTVAGCEKAEVDEEPEERIVFETCAATSQTVRVVTQQKGFVSKDQSTQQYRIFAAQPGTIDVVDVGVVCGTLPASLQVEGCKVVFSGIYKEYSNAPSGPVGYTYYYLELSKIAAQ